MKYNDLQKMIDELRNFKKLGATIYPKDAPMELALGFEGLVEDGEKFDVRQFQINIGKFRNQKDMLNARQLAAFEAFVKNREDEAVVSEYVNSFTE